MASLWKTNETEIRENEKAEACIENKIKFGAIDFAQVIAPLRTEICEPIDMLDVIDRGFASECWFLPTFSFFFMCQSDTFHNLSEICSLFDLFQHNRAFFRAKESCQGPNGAFGKTRDGRIIISRWRDSIQTLAIRL
jgi:hypothetical protein